MGKNHYRVIIAKNRTDFEEALCHFGEEGFRLTRFVYRDPRVNVEREYIGIMEREVRFG